MAHRRIHSGAPWEVVVGYCRAVVAGAHISIAGTTAVDEKGEIVGEGDAYRQTERCLAIIEAALESAGARMADVVRTRLFVTDIDQWESVARAHRAAFGASPPATTMVEVSRLMDPRMLVEVEADAVIAEASAEIDSAT